MAVVSQDQENNQQGPTGGPLQISGTSAPSSSGKGAVAGTATGGASNQPVSNVQTNPNQNAGYTDVGAYLNANQAGSQQLGNQVAQNLTNTYNTTTGDINNSSQNFQSQANAGYTPENTQLIQQVANDPTAAAANSNLTSGFESQLNDSYTGPTQWNDTTGANGQTIGGYGTLQGEVAQANQEAALPTVAGGNNVLAQQVEGANSTAGINSLDAMLLGAPGAASTVQAAAAPYAGLNDYLSAQNTANLNTVTNDQSAAAQASQDALNAFTGANGTLTGLNSSVGQELTQAQQQYQDQQNQQQWLQNQLNNAYAPTVANGPGGQPQYQISSTFGNSATDQGLLQALGINQGQLNNIIDQANAAGTSQYKTAPNFGASTPTEQMNLEQYLPQNTATAPQAATVATPQQTAEYAAINQLLGSQAPTQTEAVNPALASLAGTYNPGTPGQFNYNQALSDITGYNTTVDQAAQNQANQESAAALAQHNANSGGFLGSIENYLPVIANPTLALGASSLGQAAKKI